jgi:hypothetical protein
MHRRLISMLLLLMAAGILGPATAASAATAAPAISSPGRFGIRLYDVPAIDAHNPRGLLYIIDFLHPGTVIHRRILVRNQESHPSRFTVYPDAARITHGLFVGDPGETRSQLTSWTSVQHPALTLAPGASTLDMITISVPRGAVRGEHYGVIWVQQAALVRSGAGSFVREVDRVGVRIYLFVGHGGVPPTKFVVTSLTGHRTARGQPVLLASVADTGQRAVDLSGQARLSDGPGGISAGPFREERVVTLAPGQSGTLVFAPDRHLPPGTWHAGVTLVSGINTITHRGTVVFPGAVPRSIWARFPGLIWALGVLIGLLAIAAGWRIQSARLKATRRGHRPGVRMPGGSHGATG